MPNNYPEQIAQEFVTNNGDGIEISVISSRIPHIARNKICRVYYVTIYEDIEPFSEKELFDLFDFKI